MKVLAPHDRPREKLDRLGTTALGDHELVALVVGHGSRRQSALDVATALLRAAAGLHGLPRLTLEDLTAIEGIGRAQAARILAAVELGRRTLTHAPGDRVQLITPRDAATFLMPQYGARSVEQLGVVLLDTKHRVMKTSIVSIGTLDASVAHPREVFREATARGAAALVLFHNHPSGDPTPSPDDAALTHRLVKAGDIMGIDVLDHVILGEARYFSFREAGQL